MTDIVNSFLMCKDNKRQLDVTPNYDILNTKLLVVMFKHYRLTSHLRTTKTTIVE